MRRDDGEAALVSAAQHGDQRARQELVARYLPLVYNIVGRALNGHADVDDVVQETMIRALNSLGSLRDPERFRSWLVAITMNRIRDHVRDRRVAPLVDGAPHEVRDLPDPGSDFVDLAILRLGLSGQRREVAEASRWLDEDDRALLSLWWLEAAGQLSRAEVATALELSPQHTAVRVQRMKGQLEAARVVVRALAATPRCVLLTDTVAHWDGAPSPLWRKRLVRHTRECTVCGGLGSGLAPAEGLLVGLALVPLGAAMAAQTPETYVALAAARSTGPEGTYGTGTYETGTYETGAYGTETPDPGAHGTGAYDTSAYDSGAYDTGAYSGTTTEIGAVSAHGRVRQRADRRRQQRRRRAAVVAVAALVVGAGGIALLLPEDGEDRRTQAAREDAGATAALTAPKPSSTSATASASPSPSRSSASPSASASKKPKPSASSKRPAAKPEPSRKPVRPAPPPAPTQAPPSSFAGQVLELVNAERAEAGCSPVRQNGTLATAAQRHSADMAARDFFDHTNPDGADPGDRMTAAGYRWSTYAENIARGQQSAAAVMDGWMNSPGHRANILNCSVKEMGLGVHEGSGGPWWTQVFGTQL
ncbi:sigma-70 family RNA polymerase sigma factor [Streptomyces sp. NPDC091377]|uniref:sigma-70 family RNA polymerase sigma factor n=1 Tax=Streptomyces sp. NPDC091377 TaxID=3365995 RepID=UPI0037FE192D